MRWLEEVGLLTEEMRRVVEFCLWAEHWWEERLEPRDNVDRELKEGLKSYAYERILAERELREKLVTKWSIIYDRANAFLQTPGESQSADPPAVVNVDLPDPIDSVSDLE